jgi:hypothetical protein
MTYFSDFETVSYLDDYNARQSILKDAESILLHDSTETVPEDLLEAFEELY